MKNNIKEYLEYHGACGEGLKWCVANCTSMHDVWNKLQRHDWMLWLVCRAKCLANRDCHEFGLWCAEQVRHLMTDDRSIAALKAKRDWLDGNITDEELDAAGAAAWETAGKAWEAWETAGTAWETAGKAWEAAWITARVARTAAWAAANAGESAGAAASAAGVAAGGAARGAAGTAAGEAAGAAANAVADVREAARAAAWATAETAQLAWLRANTKPVFELPNDRNGRENESHDRYILSRIKETL